jgi:hypothetical protein
LSHVLKKLPDKDTVSNCRNSCDRHSIPNIPACRISNKSVEWSANLAKKKRVKNDLYIVIVLHFSSSPVLNGAKNVSTNTNGGGGHFSYFRRKSLFRKITLPPAGLKAKTPPNQFLFDWFKLHFSFFPETQTIVRDFGFLNNRTPTAGLCLQFDTATSG